jgi:hypothetical protein
VGAAETKRAGPTSDWQRHSKSPAETHTIMKTASARITILGGDVPLYLLLLRSCDQASKLYFETTPPWPSSVFGCDAKANFTLRQNYAEVSNGLRNVWEQATAPTWPPC